MFFEMDFICFFGVNDTITRYVFVDKAHRADVNIATYHYRVCNNTTTSPHTYVVTYQNAWLSGVRHFPTTDSNCGVLSNSKIRAYTTAPVNNNSIKVTDNQSWAD